MRPYLIAVIVIAGCSSHHSNGAADGGATVTPAKACADEANALCGLRDSCAPSFGIAHNYGTIATCQTRTAQVCVNSLDAKGSGNTTAHVEACAAAYPSEACADFYDGNPVTACAPPIGTLATGAACGASAQCTSTYCAIAQNAVCGTCQPLPVVGAPCLVQGDCGRDLACATPTVATDGGVPTSGTCAAWVTLNNACLTGHQPCQSGLACVGDDQATMTMGTCQTQPTAIAAACDATRSTAPNCNADLGMVCVPTAKDSKGVGTCQAVQLVAAGAACGDIGAAPITGFADCQNGGLCKKAVSTDATGVCVAAAADGAACDSDAANGPPCLAPAKCVPPSGSSGTAGTCVVPNASTCM